MIQGEELSAARTTIRDVRDSLEWNTPNPKAITKAVKNIVYPYLEGA